MENLFQTGFLPINDDVMPIYISGVTKLSTRNKKKRKAKANNSS